MIIGSHHNDITMKQAIHIHYEPIAFYLLPLDSSEFFCFMIVGEEGASSNFSDESDSFMSAGLLASELP